MYWTMDTLKTGLRSRMRDSVGERQRWTDSEMHSAVNRGISAMHLHAGFYISGSPPANANNQFVPDEYMIDQILFFVEDVPIVTQVNYGDTLPDNSTIKAWVYNPPMPEDTYTLTDNIDPTSTTINITSANGTFPPLVGHVTVGLEVARYHDVTYVSVNDYTLLNVERGVNGVSLSASALASVDMTVYGDDPRLHNVILDSGASYLHSLYPTDGSPTEVQHHQWMMRWHTQQVDNFWRSYLPRKEFIRRPMVKGY